MDAVGLENISPEMAYKKKRVCHAHFISPDTKKLNANTYPTLYMGHINDTLLGIYIKYF